MHKPVLLDEIVRLAGETGPKTILDVTFGRGGHTRALLELPSRPTVVAMDQDAEAIAYGIAEFGSYVQQGRLCLVHGSFHATLRNLPKPDGGFDVILADLGVSSPQLDEAGRGFSFYGDGPLDMRMNREQEFSAADLINTWSEVELNQIFMEYGEIRRPQRVVKAIVQDRRTNKFTTTRQLAGLIERVEGWKRKGFHPATTYFLAIRMAINNELEGLKDSLPDLMRALAPRGRLMIITFHSLEDRIIKYAFKESPEYGFPLFKKVIKPSREEEKANPRARSSKLRIFQQGSPP
jgi:16S rRNA (cytosine1402-N4)-methyltransferase